MAEKTAIDKAAAKGTPNWGSLLEDLQAGGSANFIFAKKPRNRIRLIHDPAQPYFVEVSSTFRRNGEVGNTKTKYMVLAIEPETDDEDGPKVKGLIVSKTVFRQIVGLLAEGYDFWDPEKGHGITINKTGTGLQTQYTVMPSQKSQPVSKDLMSDLPLLTHLQDEYAKLNARSLNGDTKTDDEGDDY